MPGHRKSPSSRTVVASELRALGVEEGGVLLVHASFRATGPIAGGPVGLVEALRTPPARTARS
jgi:aminoglycoside 3-N-acetyltransferase